MLLRVDDVVQATRKEKEQGGGGGGGEAMPEEMMEGWTIDIGSCDKLWIIKIVALESDTTAQQLPIWVRVLEAN